MSYEQEKNELTLSVLELTEALITFGFFRSQKELVDVVDPLITLMDGSHDAANRLEEEEMSQIKVLRPQ